jgi:hypothetical protein
VEEGGARYLVDTGASVSAARAVRGPLSKVAGGVLGGTVRAARMSMPPGVDGMYIHICIDALHTLSDSISPSIHHPSIHATLHHTHAGILGWDWLRHSAHQRVEFDLRDPQGARLRLDEDADMDYAQAGSFETKSLGGGELPCVDLEMFGVACCKALGVLDSGSPLTIVSPASSEAAALFDERQLSDADLPPLHTMGVDGLRAELLPKRAAGLRLGGVGGIELANRMVYSAQLPMMAAVAPTDLPLALVGLDLLGARFALDLQRGILQLY